MLPPSITIHNSSMIESQPLVCTSLHLPPDLHPFQRIYEISWHVLAPNLDRLRLVVEGTRSNSTEATEIFWKTREALRSELIKAFKILQSGTEVARRYSQVLKALEDRKPAQEALNIARMHAQMGIRVSTESQEAFSACRQELETAIDRVTRATVTVHNNGPDSSLASSQNIQVVTEIFSAIDECNKLLQQCHNQFSQLARRIRNEHTIDSDPPSEEETQVMHAKWQTFFNAVEGLWKQSLDIAEGVVFASSDSPEKSPRSRKARPNIPLWRYLLQREAMRDLNHVRNIMEASSGSTDPGTAAVTLGSSRASETPINVVNQADTMQRLQAPENRTILDPAPLDGQTPNNVKVSFWRKGLRLIGNFSYRNVSERLEVSDDAPDTTIPPPKIPHWKKLFPQATCVFKASLR